MNWAAMAWLVGLIVFLIFEAATVALVSLWFAAGALAALLVSLVCDALWVQVAAFLAVSAVLLLALRPWVRKCVKPKVTATNIDAVIGSTGLVTADIDNLKAAGQVKLGAMEWSARSVSGNPIATGTRVRVERIEGVKVFVSPEPAEECNRKNETIENKQEESVCGS